LARSPACVPCCLGPFVAILAAIAALGRASTPIIGAGGLLIVVAALTATVAVRRRDAATACRLGDPNEPVAVELTRSSR
jgi:hypothetical protein